MGVKNAAIATLRERVEASNRYAADLDELVGGARTRSVSHSPHAAAHHELRHHGHVDAHRGKSPRRNSFGADLVSRSQRSSGGGGADDVAGGYSPRSRSRGRTRTPRSSRDRD